ncbi:MAG: hypothetical protein JNM83_23330 [Myxococcales bacterium]|nr:hypothetical protein [Myxococcales bacterium]
MKKMTLLSGCLVLTVSGASCRPYLRELSWKDERVATALNNTQWYVDAYGFGSMSAPLLIKPDPAFRFAPKDATADNFYVHALNNINAKSASLNQSIFSGGSSTAVSVDFLSMQQQERFLSSKKQEAAISDEKNWLLREAAIREFKSAMMSAQTISDKTEQLKAERDAYRTLATNLPGSLVSTTANQAGTVPATAGTGAHAASATGLLTPFTPQALYASNTPGVSNEVRSALLASAGDNAIKAILSLLGDPSKISSFSDKTVMFGVTMVSVNPGWLTRQNFSADVSSKIALDFKPAGQAVRDAFAEASTTKDPTESSTIANLLKCIEETQKSPDGVSTIDFNKFKPAQYDPFVLRNEEPLRERDVVVAAVSPMAESQMLDLQSSTDRRREVALQLSLALSYAGVKGAADKFFQWASQEKQDVQSRTSNIVVNSYNFSGGVFGFEIGPRLSANQKTGAASVEKMDRQTFPVLLLIGFDKEELRPRVRIYNKEPSAACELHEPLITIDTQTEWRPLVNKRGISPFTEKERMQVRKDAYDSFKIHKQKSESEIMHNLCKTLKNTYGSSEMNKQKPDNEKMDNACKILNDAFETNRQKSENEIMHDLYQTRWDLLKTRLGENRYSFTAPIEAIRESLAKSKTGSKQPPTPTADVIVPNRVEVQAQMGKDSTAGTLVELVLIGKGLGQVDRTKIEPVLGKVTWVNGQGVDQATPNAEMVGDSMKLTFRVRGADPTIVFALPIGESKVLTPPLSVAVLPAKSSTISIERKQKDGNSETYTFSPDVSDDVKKAVVEKDKPRVISVKKDETTATSTTATPAK